MKRLTEEHKLKIGKANKSAMLEWHRTHEHPRGMLGKITSVETKKKLSDARKGKQGHKWSEEERKLISKKSKISAIKYGFGKWMKGRKLSKEHRKNISESLKGKKAYQWKGGITPINKKIRNSPEYKLWREAVFKRDKWTCVWCGQVGVRMNADHIKPFAHYPELRFAIDNGRTLCIPCHEKTDTYKSKSKKFE